MVMVYDVVVMRRPMVMVLYMMMWNHAGALRRRRSMQMRKTRWTRRTRRRRLGLAVLVLLRLRHLHHMMMFSLPFPLEVVPLPPIPFSFKLPLAVLLSFPLTILSLPLLFPISHHQPLPLPLVFFMHHPCIPFCFTPRSTGRIAVEVEPAHTHPETHPRRPIRLRASSTTRSVRKNRHRRYRAPSIHRTTFHIGPMMVVRRRRGRR